MCCVTPLSVSQSCYRRIVQQLLTSPSCALWTSTVSGHVLPHGQASVETSPASGHPCPCCPRPDHRQIYPWGEWTRQVDFHHRRKVGTSGLPGRGRTSPASRQPELYVHVPRGRCSNGEVPFAPQSRLV